MPIWFDDREQFGYWEDRYCLEQTAEDEGLDNFSRDINNDDVSAMMVREDEV